MKNKPKNPFSLFRQRINLILQLKTKNNLDGFVRLMRIALCYLQYLYSCVAELFFCLLCSVVFIVTILGMIALIAINLLRLLVKGIKTTKIDGKTLMFILGLLYLSSMGFYSYVCYKAKKELVVLQKDYNELENKLSQYESRSKDNLIKDLKAIYMK